MTLPLLLAALLPAADYTREVKPLLVKHCAGCHGPEKQRASLRVDSARAREVDALEPVIGQ